MTPEVNTALRRVTAEFPEWSTVQLANKLLMECSRAILSDEPPSLPTIDYIRHQIQLERLQNAARDVAASPTRYVLNEEPPKQAGKKRAA